MVEAAVEVKLTYDKSEIKKAISYYILRVCGFRLYALITYTILFAAIIVSLVFSKYAPLSIVFIFAGFILYYLYYQRPIDGYLKYYQKTEACIYRFSNDRVHVVSEEIQSQFLWSVFKKGYEIPFAFLLLDDNKFVYVFSKSRFSDDQSIEQTHDLLSKRIPNFKVFLND